MYRCIKTGDIHASNNLPFAVRDPKTLITDRLMDVVILLDQIHQYALDNVIEDVWLLGDVLDRRLLDAVVTKVVTMKLKAMIDQGLKIMVIPGNHEAYDASCHHYTVEYLQAIGVLVAGGDEGVAWIRDTHRPNYIACPYLPDITIIKALADMKDVGDYIPLLHQTIKGGKVGEWEADHGIDPEMLAPFRATFAGHFHTPQQLLPNAWYLGAPMQHNFGDTEEVRGFWDVTIPSVGPIRRKMITNNLPQFWEYDWTGAAGELTLLKSWKLHRNDYLRVRYAGTAAELRTYGPEVEKFCTELKREHGLRMAKPASRLKAEPSKARLPAAAGRSWPSLVAGFVDSCDVTGTNKERLKALGATLLVEAEEDG